MTQTICWRRRVWRAEQAQFSRNQLRISPYFKVCFFTKHPGDLDRLVNADNGDSHFCRFLRGDPVWNTSSPVWKRIALEKLGGFDEKLSCWHDVEIHQRALIFGLEYESYLAHAPDVVVRCHSKGSVSQDGYKTREAIGSIFMVYGKAAQVLASSINPASKAALRQMLAHAMRHALKYRFFDLARAGIVCGKKDRLLNPFHRTIWGIACLAHFARAQGFSGWRVFGEKLDETVPASDLGRKMPGTRSARRGFKELTNPISGPR